jgi:polyphosphate kinase
LIPGVKGMTNIEAISIVNYLEHTRIYILEMPDKQRFYFFSRFYESESRWTGRGDMLSMIKKSKELIDNFDLGWKEMYAYIRLIWIINIAKNNDPVFRAQIETYKYYQNKVELLDETFRNSSFILFRIQMEMQNNN